MSVPEWQRNAQLFAALTQTTSTIGLYVGDQDGLALVQIGDGQIPVRYGTKYKPRPGDGVVLTFEGDSVRLTGPTASRSKLGTVTAVSATVLSVECDGSVYDGLPFTVSYQKQSNDNQTTGPAVGDTVAIDWDGYYVIDRVTDTGQAPSVPVLSTNLQDFTLTFYPDQSGSYTTSAGTWNGATGDLYCDDRHQAAWFYGDKVRTSLQDDAYIASVEVYLSVRAPGTSQPTLGRHSDPSQQSTGVSLTSGATRGAEGWIRLPITWAQDWRTGIAGLSIAGGGSVYRGIGTDHQSGKLRIRGRQ